MRISEKTAKIELQILLYIFIISVAVYAVLYLNTILNPYYAIILQIVIVSIIIVLSLKIISIIYIHKNQEKLLKFCKGLTKLIDKKFDSISEEINDYYVGLETLGIGKIIPCSYSVVANASTKKISYLIKYSNISYKTDELTWIDKIIDYLTDHEAFIGLMNKSRDRIIEKVPFILRPFINKNKVAYYVHNIDYEASKIDYKATVFRYISPTGKSSHSTTIIIDIATLKSLQEEISRKIAKKRHAKRQRSAMTNDLREAIKKRDDYTCQICGNSVYNEPNLLLEVDHITPVSKGGKTKADNLQTLCWRCNREKHDK